MNIMVQDKNIDIKSQDDFENAIELMHYYFNIEKWMESKRKWEFFSFEKVFEKYGV